MRDLQELIDAIKDVPSDKFDQNSYSVLGECGCVMHWFEKKNFGKLAYDFNYKDFGLDDDEDVYIFCNTAAIKEVAELRGWPISKTFDVQSAIERIEFIKKLKER